LKWLCPFKAKISEADTLCTHSLHTEHMRICNSSEPLEMSQGQGNSTASCMKTPLRQEDGAESCATTALGQDDRSSLGSPREDDSHDEVEYGSVNVHSWKTASFSDDPEGVWPINESSIANGCQAQGLPMMYTAWVPVAVPYVVAVPDMHSVAFSNMYPTGDAAQPWAKAEECQRAANELHAVAQQVQSGAVATDQGEQISEAAFWQRQAMPAALHKTSAMTGVHAGRTTVMFRNIPNNYSRSMLLELLDEEGFAACYDFIYLPRDFNRNGNLGYAFVNCVSAEVAARFHAHFNGFRRWCLASQKVGEVGWAKPLQGLEAYIERYRNSPVMHPSTPDDHKPLLFSQGQCVPFPPPTKLIRLPRMKA